MTTKEKKLSKENKLIEKKEKGLFDHIKHIRKEQNSKYYDSLSENERKSFNHFMILKALSMDSELIEFCSLVYKYFDKIPSKQFYKLLIDIIPKSNRFFPWIKSKKVKHKDELLDLISNYFELSKKQANDCINILISNDKGLNNLIEICKANGKEDKEIENMLGVENEKI